VQLEKPLLYPRSWKWTNKQTLEGHVVDVPIQANEGEWEIWDYKGVRAENAYIDDYVRQLVTYAALFEERTGKLPARCVLFFVNEQKNDRQLLAIPIDSAIGKAGIEWTIEQAKLLRASEILFQKDPLKAVSGSLKGGFPAELKAQCTTCGQRFDCKGYIGHLGDPNHNDVRRDYVHKN
jgi:hypothetical protein